MTEQSTTGSVPALPEDAAPLSAEGAAPLSAEDAAPLSAEDAVRQSAEDAAPLSAEDAAPLSAEDAAPLSAEDEQGAARAAAFAADPLAAYPFAAPEVPAAPKDRRKLFAALRWTAAVLVFGAVGTGVAYGVAQPARTDMPGLSTKADGRWTFPALAKPALPPGAALPFAEDNPGGIHYAGLSELLVPAPTGSAPDSTLKLEKDGMVTVDTLLDEYEATSRAKLKEEFGNEGLRQIAARGWTTPDGTRTRVYLLRFHTHEFLNTFKGCGVDTGIGSAARLEIDTSWRNAKSSQRHPLGARTSGYSTQGNTSEIILYQEPEPTGDEQTKLGCIQSGDIQALVVQTRKGGVATVPFHQTVILQHQLLG